MRGFSRVSVAVPVVRVADFDGNVAQTLALLERAHGQGDALVVFPELGLCGYTVRDLVLDHHLLESCEAALELYDPRFFRFMLAQEKADAALRAEGIEPEPDRYMPREVVKYKAPGRLIDTEGVDDLNWKPKSKG